jgi:hypothetical protein
MDPPARLSERSVGEAYLASKGATVLMLAGLWGRNSRGVQRHPKKWFDSGRIADLDKYLNLVEVSDVCRVTHALLTTTDAIRGQYFVCSDGHPYLWSDLARVWEGGQSSGSTTTSSDRPKTKADSKKCDNSKLDALLEGLAWHTLNNEDASNL